MPFNPFQPDACEASPGDGNMRPVATAPKTKQARKLRALLDHLAISETEFAERIGMSQSQVNRIANGERTADRPSKLLVRGARDAFGVSWQWWDDDDGNVADYISQGQVNPAVAALLTKAEANGTLVRVGNTLVASPSDLGAAFARFAAKRKLGARVVEGLLVAKPPADADVTWWLGLLFDLLDKK